MLEDLAVLSAITRELRFELAPGVRVVPYQGLTLIPEGSTMRMTVHKLSM